MKILVTGVAGFIGFHTAAKLLSLGHTVTGIDNLNDYYSPQLKKDRLAELAKDRNATSFRFEKIDVADRDAMEDLFTRHQFDRVVHLAAQAGVRYSLTNPHAYIQSNIVGFMNVLEACRAAEIEHLVYASSSSVYGLNEAIPFSEDHNVDHPVSLYAASKKSNELMAHTYSHLYGLPTTGLRFFTVYGPWGRPDMSPFLFASAILEKRSIDVFNFGNHMRDFTYIDDIVEGVVKVLEKVPAGNPEWDGSKPSPSSSKAPYRIYNIGNNQPVKLMDFIETMERSFGATVEKQFKPLQPGDVPDTAADVHRLAEDIGYKPKTSIDEGLSRFAKWYVGYFHADDT